MRLQGAPGVCAVLALGCAITTCAQADGPSIPPTLATALDGHSVMLPRDLPAKATVMILGFGRHSSEATTAWEKPVRTQLAHIPLIGFFDMAMLSQVPGLMKPIVIRAIRHEVPDALRPSFLPLLDGENEWKRVAGYVPEQAEAAYVLLVDRQGKVRWATHAPFSPAQFAQLKDAAQRLAHEEP